MTGVGLLSLRVTHLSGYNRSGPGAGVRQEPVHPLLLLQHVLVRLSMVSLRPGLQDDLPRVLLETQIQGTINR